MKHLLLLFASFFTAAAFAQDVKVVSGKLDQYKNFESKFIQPRNVDVWLPEGYSPKNRYAVMYMHDGQMLFDPSTTWNKQAWNADDVASQLLKDKKVPEFIIVGIYNISEIRHQNYFPQKPYEKLTPEQKEFVDKNLQKAGRIKGKFQPDSDNYLKFLVSELKPFIDKKYSVYTDAAHTFIGGSSMGGLISMYAICEYPNVFGGAACISTHWPGLIHTKGNPVPQVFLDYLKQNLPSPKNHKIYFDHGDLTIDVDYAPFQKKADEIMKSKGFTAKNWKTQFFPGTDHSEKSWEARLNIPFEFLMKK